jgi:hypothetical protein
MIWYDLIRDILSAINGASVYNAARSTTPSALDVVLYNQAQDWLCMYKPWRDLRVKVQIPLDVDRKVLLPGDFGCMISVSCDPSNIGKPMYWYTLCDNDVSRRYDEEVTVEPFSGVKMRRLVFPPTVFLPQDPTITYSRVPPAATVDDRGSAKFSFFPMNIMLVVAKKIMQDYYGVAANQDPKWINDRVAEELRMFEAYAYNNNVALDMAIKDRFGNPVFIPGMSLNGSGPRMSRPSPFLPSTFYSGGTI